MKSILIYVIVLLIAFVATWGMVAIAKADITIDATEGIFMQQFQNDDPNLFVDLCGYVALNKDSLPSFKEACTVYYGANGRG